MNAEALTKMIEVKRMDLEECEYELNNRYYPSIIRIAMMNYISELRQQIETCYEDIELLKVE